MKTAEQVELQQKLLELLRAGKAANEDEEAPRGGDPGAPRGPAKSPQPQEGKK